jgi:hypothetical protein
VAEPAPVTSVYPTRDEAIAQGVAELVADGGGELLIHAAACRGNPEGVGCTCMPEVHLIREPGRA